MAITYRVDKGTGLTNAEIDANFSTLDQNLKIHTHGNITTDGKIGTTPNKLLITDPNGKIITTTFSNQSGTVAEGNHTHGNITTDGKIGTTPNKLLITDSNGKIITTTFSNQSGTVAEGNHLHTAVYEPADSTILKEADIGVSGGVLAYSAKLTTIAGLNDSDNNFIVGSGTGWTVESGSTARLSLGLGNAAVLNTGTTSGTVATGDHTHGNITTDGNIGSTANLPVITGDSGAVTTTSVATFAALMHSTPVMSVVNDASLIEGYDNTINVTIAAPVAGTAIIAVAFNPTDALSNSFTLTLKKEASVIRTDTSVLSQSHFAIETVTSGNTAFSLQVKRDSGTGTLTQTASYYLLAFFIPA